ncbi:ABC transporter transmembrane domain-containing protein [Salana multivorans]
MTIDDARKPAPPASEPSTPATEGGRTDSLRGGLPLLWGYARPHLRTIALGTLLGLFATAVTLATPLATKWVLDSLGTGLDLTRPAVVLVVLLVIGTIAGLAQAVLLGRLAEHVVLDARRALVQRFFRAKLEQIQRFRSGELVTRVTSDTVLLREAATSSIVNLVNGAVSLVGTIVLMAVLDVSLLLTTLAALLVIGLLLGILVPRIGKADKRAQDAIGVSSAPRSRAESEHCAR